MPSLAGAPDALKSWAVIAANCLVKDPDLRLALVDLKRMSPAVGGGTERLKQISERKNALRSAQDAIEHQEAQVKRARSNALEALQSSVRQGLIPLVDKNYGIVAYRDDDKCIKFDIGMDNKVKLQVTCHFEWLLAFTPLVANVTLTASIGAVPEGANLKRKAVSQLSARPGADAQFGSIALDAVSDVVATTAEHLALGAGNAAEPQFVDAILLLVPN